MIIEICYNTWLLLFGEKFTCKRIYTTCNRLGSPLLGLQAHKPFNLGAVGSNSGPQVLGLSEPAVVPTEPSLQLPLFFKWSFTTCSIARHCVISVFHSLCFHQEDRVVGVLPQLACRPHSPVAGYSCSSRIAQCSGVVICCDFCSSREGRFQLFMVWGCYKQRLFMSLTACKS